MCERCKRDLYYMARRGETANPSDSKIFNVLHGDKFKRQKAIWAAQKSHAVGGTDSMETRPVQLMSSTGSVDDPKLRVLSLVQWMKFVQPHVRIPAWVPPRDRLTSSDPSKSRDTEPSLEKPSSIIEDEHVDPASTGFDQESSWMKLLQQHPELAPQGIYRPSISLEGTDMAHAGSEVVDSSLFANSAWRAQPDQPPDLEAILEGILTLDSDQVRKAIDESSVYR